MTINVPDDPPRLWSRFQDSPRFREKFRLFRAHASPQSTVFLYNLCTDGVSPFALKFRQTYSVWPIFLEVLNTPYPHDVILLGLIGGPKGPKDLTVYMSKITDNLEKISNSLCQLKDQSGVERYVQWYCMCCIADGPAHAKVLVTCPATRPGGTHFMYMFLVVSAQEPVTHQRNKAVGFVIKKEPRSPTGSSGSTRELSCRMKTRCAETSHMELQMNLPLPF